MASLEVKKLSPSQSLEIIELVVVLKRPSVLSPVEYEALQAPAAAFMNVTAAEILKMKEEKR